MKKIFAALGALLLCAGANAQTFKVGDMVGDIGIGVGVANSFDQKGSKFPNWTFDKANKATFTQKIAFEYGVANIGSSVLGVGFLIDNAYGAGYTGIAYGTYDYNYSSTVWRYTTNHNRYVWSSGEPTIHNRKGAGYAKASMNLENVDVMLKASLHHEFIDNLDTYLTIGAGVSVYKWLISPDESVSTGLSKRNETLDRNDKHTQVVFNYNDFDHVKWNGGKAKAHFSMAAFVGARYYITPTWAVNAELGLTSASFKKNQNTFNIFSLGASYKF